ncbi:NAD(P)-binding domain containing protein [Parasponia andersonii]|uniref:NAD(P)-binding domain containing protein n=1 Tax=Parasponia andersonii TaxID=3476 RepID=A0A2P5DPG1_PARAD|nr:NAD(P)-binding domain containing protein [Parasponia andersonii]
MDRKFESKGKVCVTGASGFLASWLVKRLLLSGYHAEILKPAIDGTLNVLRSCRKNPFLWRVVLTSSSSTTRARDDFDPKIPLDESSWSSVELCERLQHKTVKWSSNAYLSNKTGETEKFQWHGRMGYVHIDDVAACHILVYEHKNAHGRYLCSSTVVDNDELASLLSARYPSLPIPERFEQQNRPYYEFNTSKLRSLGFKFKTINEMFDDCISSLMEQGHLSTRL